MEFKKTVYKLTKYHPELINDIFPWFRKVTVEKLEYFEMTNWGKNILDSYYELKHSNVIKGYYAVFGQILIKIVSFIILMNIIQDY